MVGWDLTLFVESFVRTNFRALALRENRKFLLVLIFAHLQIFKVFQSFQKPWYMATRTKNRGRFAIIYLRFIFEPKSDKFSTYFRVISCKIRFCPKMREIQCHIPCRTKIIGEQNLKFQQFFIAFLFRHTIYKKKYVLTWYFY